MNKSNGDTFVSRRGHTLHNGFDLSANKRNQHITGRINPLFYGITHLTRQQRLWENKIEIVLFKTALGAHLNHITKPISCDQCGFCPTPFNQCIGSQGCAMNDLPDLRGHDSSLGADLLHSVYYGIFRCNIRCQNLGRIALATSLKHHIRKCATDIHTQSNRLRFHNNHLHFEWSILTSKLPICKSIVFCSINYSELHTNPKNIKPLGVSKNVQSLLPRRN